MAYGKAVKEKIKPTKELKKATPREADEFFDYVQGKYDDSIGNRSTWVSKQVRYNKLRMRIKKAKVFPFVGCSNIRMPTAEIKIRKVKSALFNVIFGVRPVVQCVPPPNGSYETALKIEKFLDHLIMDRIKIQNKAVIALDQELEQGFYLFAPFWNLEITRRNESFDANDLSIEETHTLFSHPENIKKYLLTFYDVDMDERIADENDKSVSEAAAKIATGESKVSFYVQDIINDIPDVELVAPERCYVPSTSGFDPQTNECSITESYMPFHQLQTNATYFGWNIEGVEDIARYKKSGDITPKESTRATEDYQREQNKDIQEGIDRLNSGSHEVRIWKYCGWYDLDGDGFKEKIIGFCAPDFKKTLYKASLPFINGKFPLVKLFYELTDNRWYAHRGIVEIAEDVIKEIDIQHQMKIDQQTIRNAPMFMYRAGQVNPNLIQLIPNQAIPVRGLQPLRDTVDILNNNNPNVEFSYDREQQILAGQLEELIGQVDYTLQSQINKRQPRTLGEVQLQAQNAQQVFALDAGMHTEQFTELFNFIWDLWCQYGKDEYEFNYFGANGWEKIKLTKEEVQGRYKIVVRGNDRNTNPQTRLQKANQIILAATNPVFVQSGVVTPPQMINSLKRFYQYLEVDNWEELINLQWQPPPPNTPKLSELMKIDFANLTDAEKMQVLMANGIQPDVQGRMLDKQHEVLQTMSDHSGGSNGGNGQPGQVPQ